uniref:Ig-like domain-containing protein n=1 Tax=Strigamia maritima TaxID=126957 RepID=T1IYV4_STRMM
MTSTKLLHKCGQEEEDELKVVEIKLLEKPAAPPEVSLEQREMLNGSTIGPINEGELLNLTCRSRKGRPLPEVSWWNGWTKLDSQMVHADEEFLSYADTSNALQPEESVGRQQAINFLRLDITRKYLNSTLQCRVQNDALAEPLISWFKLDVHENQADEFYTLDRLHNRAAVRPISLELNGAQSPMAAGTPVRLVCTSKAAKPPAVLTWMNGSSPLHPQPHAQTSPAGDGTYTTQSMLSFTATHMHNGMKVSCIATNRVMQDKHEKPFSKSIDFEVLYPPIVTLSPDGNMTVQEGDSATITCAYVSNPRQITGKRWLRDDRPLRLVPHLEIMDGVADQMKLVFHNVTRGDQGVYGCQVRNSVGTGISSETFTLDVQ